MGRSPQKYQKKKDPTTAKDTAQEGPQPTDKELEEEFNCTVDEKFVTLLSDGSEVELCIGGRQRQVTLENL
jgi:uncharacterized membrane protein YebE (DUF533 family)